MTTTWAGRPLVLHNQFVSSLSNVRKGRVAKTGSFLFEPGPGEYREKSDSFLKYQHLFARPRYNLFIRFLKSIMDSQKERNLRDGDETPGTQSDTTRTERRQAVEHAGEEKTGGSVESDDYNRRNQEDAGAHQEGQYNRNSSSSGMQPGSDAGERD